MFDKSILYLDMDGVLFDYDTHFKTHNLRRHQPEPQGFFETIPIFPGAVEFVNALYDSGKFEIYFLSTPAWDSPTSYTEKRLALESHFRNEIVYKRLILSHNKGLLNGHFIIDDRKVNGVENFEGIHLHYGDPNSGFLSYESILKYFNIKTKTSKIFLVGVTGIIGSGKSTFVAEMGKLGYETYSSDKAVLHLLKTQVELKLKLSHAFGLDILDENGEVITSKLGQVAFRDDSNVIKLNEIIHPYLREEFENYLKYVEKKYPQGKVVVIWEAPLLFETGLDKICDYTVGVGLPLEEAKARAMSRGMSETDFDSRMRFQLTNKHTKCDFIVLNVFSLDNLKHVANNLHKILKFKLIGL